MRPRRVFLAAALGALVLQSLRLYGAFDVLQFVLERSSGPGGAALFVPAYAAACLLCLPGSVLTFGAGALFGFAKGAALVLLGANLGALSAFLFSRHLLYDAVHARVQKSRRLRALDRAVSEQGWKVVALARMSPLFPFNLLNYALGVTDISLAAFVTAGALGMVPGTLLYVWMGSAADEAVSGRLTAARWAVLGLSVAAAGLAFALVGRAAKRELDKGVL